MLKGFHTEGLLEAGCDEAGRGCLAGPVFAAAVILPAEYQHALLQDSKKLSEAQRLQARDLIQQNALAWAVTSASPEEIDALNILHASILAMHRAISALDIKPELLLIDGNRFKPYPNIPHHCVVKGDALYSSIAAASILAKTARDAYMLDMSAEFPQYAWDKNKGYPTEAHRLAIQQFGPSPLHRTSFRLLPDNKQGLLFQS